MAEDASKLAVWLTTPNHIFVEIAKDLGYSKFLLDIEHGLFDLEPTDRLIAFIKALGCEVYAKVLGPSAVPIQQALDMGVDGVIIPHILGVEHAREVTAVAKYPPLGLRSFAGTRTAKYGGVSQAWYESENKRTKCFPMIESKEACADVEKILALPTVDGCFPRHQRSFLKQRPRRLQEHRRRQARPPAHRRRGQGRRQALDHAGLDPPGARLCARARRRLDGGRR